MTNLGQSCVSLLRQWSSGRIIAFQAIGRGSIPFWRIFLWLSSVVFFMYTGNRCGRGMPQFFSNRDTIRIRVLFLSKSKGFSDEPNVE